MKKILAIFKNDLKEIYKRPAAAFVLFGLVIIPGMYAWLNIDSNWNPYENTGNLPIAIVNKDKGTVILNENINMGNSLVESLKGNNAMKWSFTDEAEAREKVNKSEFYGEIDIPEDFSKNIVLIFENGNIKRSELDFYVNQKKNPIAPIIVSKAVGAIQTTINQNIVNALIYKSLGMANSAKLLTNHIKSTDDIIDKLNKGKEGVYDLSSIFKVLKLIADSTNNSISALRDLLPTVNSLTGTSEDGIKNIKGTMDSFKNLSNDIDNVVDSIENDRKEILDIINSFDLDPMKENKDIISNKISEIDTRLTNNKERIQNIQTLISILGEHVQLEGLSALQRQLQEVVNEIDNTQTIISNNRKTEKDINNINKKLKSIHGQEKGVSKAYRNDIKKNLDSAYDNSSKSMDILSDLLNNLDGAAEKTDSALAYMMKAIGNSKDLTDNLDNTCSRLQNDIGKIIDNLSDSKKSEMYNKFVNLIKNDPVDVANFLSTPVETVESAVYGTDKNGSQLTYGSKMAPFYSVLACWVGCILLITIVKTEITGVEGIEKFKNYQKFLGRFAIFALMALSQGFLVGLGDIFLKVQVKYPFYFILTIMITSFVFMLFVYSLTLSFGRVGEGMSVIVLVLQIAGSGGTFPVEMLPKAFQFAQPIMPFYPAMNLIRETIGGFYGNNFLKYMLMLLSHMIIPLLLGLIFRTPLIHMLEKVNKKLKKTAIII